MKEVINMPNTNLNIRIDKDLKKDAEKVFSSLGLTTTAAFTVFAKTVVREQGIPFKLSLQSNYNADTLSAMDDAVKHRHMSKKFHNIKELMDDLNADD